MPSNQLVHAALLTQLLSFLIAVTGVTSEVLATAGINCPTLQSFFNYSLLAICFGGIQLYKRQSLRARWYYYPLLAFIDVEANMMVVKAYQYTYITSVTLLDCLTIPAVMLLSWFLLKSKFRGGHAAGSVLCVLGLMLLVLSDGASGDASRPVLGDALVVAGAMCYAIENVAQERLLEDVTVTELLAMIGIWGALISGVQVLIFETSALQNAQFTESSVLAMVGFALSLFTFYTLMPLTIMWGGATIVNVGLLTSDLWAAGARILFFGGFNGSGWAFSGALALEAAGIAMFCYSGDVRNEGRGGSATAAEYERLPQKVEDEELAVRSIYSETSQELPTLQATMLHAGEEP